MVDNACDFRSQIGLFHIEDIVIDQGYFIDSFSRWVLLPEFIVEVKLALIDLAIFEMENDLKIAVEVSAIAVNYRDPLLV